MQLRVKLGGEYRDVGGIILYKCMLETLHSLQRKKAM